MEELLDELKIIQGPEKKSSAIEQWIRNYYNKRSVTYKIRQTMDNLNATIKDCRDNSLIKEVDDLELLIWGTVDDLIDQLYELGERNELSPKKIEFYVENFKKIKKGLEKGEKEVGEVLRKIGLLLLSLNNEVGNFDRL